jgi:hypothetical protein
MGLQKYRADAPGELQKNGALPFYTNWIGGPSLALIRNCPIESTVGYILSNRTVYITGEAENYWMRPAVCRGPWGKTIRGYVYSNEDGELGFRAYIG